MSKDSSVKNK